MDSCTQIVPLIGGLGKVRLEVKEEGTFLDSESFVLAALCSKQALEGLKLLSFGDSYGHEVGACEDVQLCLALEVQYFSVLVN